MRLFLKSSVIIIAVLMLFSCAAIEEETVPEFSSEFSGKVDYDGRNVTVAYQTSTANGSEVFLFGYKQDSPVGDTMIKRISEIEADYNCKLDFYSVDDPATLIPSFTASQLIVGDIYYLDAMPFRQVANSGYIMEYDAYSEIIDINDSFRWGKKNVLEIMTCNGKLYGLVASSWVDNLAPYYFTVVSNNDILKKNGFSDPREYYENGTWNRDLFEQIVSSCANPDITLYGFESALEFILRMAVHSNGVGLIDYATGVARSAWHTDKAIAGLEWAKGFIDRNSAYLALTGEAYTNFLVANAAMCMCDTHRLCKLIAFSDDIDEFAVIPFPSGDEVDYGTVGGFLSTALNTISIPVLSESVEETAHLINDLFAPMEGYETLEALDAYYTRNIFFNDMDIEILKKLTDSAEYVYHVESAATPIGSICSAVSTGTSTPSQAIETYVEAIDKIIEEYILPNKEGLDAYFND